MILPNYLLHRERNKRKVLENAEHALELVFNHATRDTSEEVEEQTVKTFTEEYLEPELVITVTNTDSELRHVCKVTSVKVLQCYPEEPSEPEPKQEDKQSCRKHSRCHCNLLSLDTSDFFTIKV